MCVSRFVGSAQGVARGRGLVYTGSSGSPSLKASMSLGRTGLCTSDPGPHADAALISLPPDMDSEDARAPWDPCGAAAPIPHTRGEGQPLHCPPLQDGRPVTQPSSSCSSGSTAPSAPPRARTSSSSAMLPGPRPASLRSPRGQPGLCFPRQGQVLSSAGAGPREASQHRVPGPLPPGHFLKGASLLKVCQKSDGFLLGSARANTCCCGRLLGTVTWRWWTGRRLWSGGAAGQPP